MNNQMIVANARANGYDIIVSKERGLLFIELPETLIDVSGNLKRVDGIPFLMLNQKYEWSVNVRLFDDNQGWGKSKNCITIESLKEEIEKMYTELFIDNVSSMVFLLLNQ